jgi:hypothetical protein
VGFETTIPASDRAKTVHDLDRSATVTGKAIRFTVSKFLTYQIFLIYFGRILFGVCWFAHVE